MMVLLLGNMIDATPLESSVVDIAPTGAVANDLKTALGRRYLSLDFDPAADGRLVDAQASLTRLPLRDDSVGLLLCSHVLEHVPDDAAAVAEISRTLDPYGLALIQVPRRLGVPTDEDPLASAEDRVKRFGQADHVRYYGDDFEERLEAGGLKVLNTSFSKILPLPLLRLIGATKDEELWLATTGTDPTRFIDTQSVTMALARALMRSEPREHELAEARSQAQAWRSHYTWLRNRPAIRAASFGKRRVKRLLSTFKAT